MWINPKYRDQVEQPKPPAENGRRLATFVRGNGVELRVNFSTYQDKPFLSLRVWERDQQSGEWWPCKGKGCSIRISEAGELAEALAGVAPGGARDAHPQPRDDRGRRQAAEGQGGPARGYSGGRPGETPYGPKGGAGRPPWDAQKLAGGKPSEGFNEFDEN